MTLTDSQRKAIHAKANTRTGISKRELDAEQQRKWDEQFNPIRDFNEKNFGLVKLRLKYPNETDQQIFERIRGRR